MAGDELSEVSDADVLAAEGTCVVRVTVPLLEMLNGDDKDEC